MLLIAFLNFFDVGFGLVFLLGFGFLRGIPIDERGGDFFPLGALNAVIADRVAFLLVAADELEAAVFQERVLPRASKVDSGSLDGSTLA